MGTRALNPRELGSTYRENITPLARIERSQFERQMAREFKLMLGVGSVLRLQGQGETQRRLQDTTERGRRQEAAIRQYEGATLYRGV